MTAPSHVIDTSVLAYALGDQHPRRRATRQVVQLAADGAIVLHASVEMVQELLHHRIPTLLSDDTDFDVVPGLTRLSPDELA